MRKSFACETLRLRRVAVSNIFHSAGVRLRFTSVCTKLIKFAKCNYINSARICKANSCAVHVVVFIPLFCDNTIRSWNGVVQRLAYHPDLFFVWR